MRPFFLFIISSITILSCSSDEKMPDINDALYFPPMNSTTWETVDMQELNWNVQEAQALYDLLEEKDTKAFIVLKNGKIAIEKYFGSFTSNRTWYWASAGKTLTAFTVGIAQENGLLSIENKTSDYLGVGWTSAAPELENRITIKNQLTMTSGLNALFFSCVKPDCLKYKADAGTRWAYHNGPYTLLQSVVSAAANEDWNLYFNSNLRDKIGMDGEWVANGNNNTYYSTPRSMARFGLLCLNNGVWDTKTILDDMRFINDMKNTSQNLNKSYGYLWWLNGKESHMGTGSQQVFSGSLIPNAPVDTYAGLGKNDQKLYIVPSKGLVIVRMGEDAGENQLGPSSFDNLLWEKINVLIN